MLGARILSIGHSSQPLDKFLRLLSLHRIEVLVDVRSTPYSRYSPQFSIHVLRKAVTDAGCEYVFLGKELGGRPEGREFYDAAGHVMYDQRAQAPEFIAGIASLAAEVERYRGAGPPAGRVAASIAMMCSEENPELCHRRLLVGRALWARGIAVDHIRGDGRLQAEFELAPIDDGQGELF